MANMKILLFVDMCHLVKPYPITEQEFYHTLRGVC